MVAEPVAEARKVVYVETVDDLRRVYKVLRASSRVALDYETTGLDPHTDQVLLTQFCGDADMVSYVVPTRGTNPTHLIACLALLGEDQERVTIAHNCVFEYKHTLKHFGVRLGKSFDTMLAESILTAGLNDMSRGLGPTAKRRLGLDLDKGEQKSFIGVDADTFVASPEQIEYAAHDVAILHDLMRVQTELLEHEGLGPTALLEFSALPVFARMELAGMYLDLDQHAEVLAGYQAEATSSRQEALDTLSALWAIAEERQRAAAEREHSRLVAALEPYGKLNKDTPDDVRKTVEDLRKARNKAKPKPVTPLSLTCRLQVLAALKEAGIDLPDLTAQTVEDHAHENPVLGVYARWATANKIVSTYGENLRARVNPSTGRVHGDFNQIVSTGRTSSREPNMQNMPKKIRACFKPAPGNAFVVADFANMELRVAAALSQDPVMLDAFREGKDLHQMTAAAAWPEKYSDWTAVPKNSDDRALGKTANFASIYGSSPRGLVTRGVIDDITVAEEVINGISSLYSTMWRFLKNTAEQAARLYYAETALGRKRYFQRLGPQPRDPELAQEWRKSRGGIKRAAMNMPVQGTSADIAKRAMVLIAKELAEGENIVCMVHDEIVTECPSDYTEAVSELVLKSMERAGAELVQGVPITADVHVVQCWEK